MADTIPSDADRDLINPINAETNIHDYVADFRDSLLQYYAYTVGAFSRVKTTPSHINADHIMNGVALKLHSKILALLDLARKHPEEFRRLEAIHIRKQWNNENV